MNMRLKIELAGVLACIVPISASAQVVTSYQAAPAVGVVESAPIVPQESLGAAPSETSVMGLEGSAVTTLDELTQATSLSGAVSAQRSVAVSRPLSAAVAHSVVAHSAVASDRNSPLSAIRETGVRADTGRLSTELDRFFTGSRALAAAPETKGVDVSAPESSDSLGTLNAPSAPRSAYYVTGFSNAAVHAAGAEGTSLWSRFWNVIRSIFGAGVRKMENPELMLRQYMDDVKVNGGKMQEAVIAVEKTGILLKGQIDSHTKEIAEMDAQVQAAVKLGPAYEEHAKQIIAAMETAQKSLEDTQHQYETQQAALKRAKEARDAYKAKMEQRINEARALIAKDKQATADKELASIMSDAFGTTGSEHDDVFNRMKEKVEERAADAQARMNNVQSDSDKKMEEIKKATANIGVEAKLAQYKAKLGGGIAGASGDAIKGAGSEALSLWKRFWNAIRSIFGAGVRKMENPELMLRQYMDDIKVNGAKMQEAVIAVEKTGILLKGQIDSHTKEIAEMDAQIQTAVKLGPAYEEHAKQIIAAMETAQKSLEDTQHQYETQQAALARAKEARDAYKAKMEQRINEARALIAKDKQATADKELASIMSDAFGTSGNEHDDVFNRMKEKVEERAADAQARMNNVQSDADKKMEEIKKATAKIGVEDKLAEYKKKAGLQ
jgi:phage shock protein A